MMYAYNIGYIGRGRADGGRSTLDYYRTIRDLCGAKNAAAWEDVT